jgi:uncharacterized membrane protein YdbT with pleckstrin-like domain
MCRGDVTEQYWLKVRETEKAERAAEATRKKLAEEAAAAEWARKAPEREAQARAAQAAAEAQRSKMSEECREAKEALMYAIVGVFCCGIILEPIAIYKALRAKKMIAANPNLTGEGKATAALVIAMIVLAFFVIVMFYSWS